MSQAVKHAFLICSLSVVICAAGANDPDPFDGDKLFADLGHYYELGEHRTATQVDVATGEWLHRRLQEAGLDAEFHDWSLLQFFLDESSLSVGDRTVDCFPYWLPKATGVEPASGAPVAIEAETDPALARDRIAIVNMRVVRSSAGMNLAIGRLAKAGARGVIFTISGRVDLPVAMNARPPYAYEVAPIPAVIVGSDSEPVLQQALVDGTELFVIIRGSYRSNARARNVIGRLERGDHWVVVSTPYSGWFGCAGERGSGISIWLALAEWAASSDSKLSWLFVANSGHEINYVGAEHSLESGVIPGPEKTNCWLHLGAGIGVVDWKKTDAGWQRDPSVPRVNLMTIPDWGTIMKTSFARVTGHRLSTERKAGELGNVHRRGYRAFGLIGGGANPWGHTRGDTPRSAEPSTLELIARSTANALAAIEGEAELKTEDRGFPHPLTW
jgi:hypothetical protein